MDGTFLDSEKNYDKKRFIRLYGKMKEDGIRFVIASGNQYFRLRSYFKGIEKELIFVAENGAYIVENDQEFFSASIDKSSAKIIIDELSKHKNITTICCGKKSAYVLDTCDSDHYALIMKYCPVLTRVKTFEDVEDQILKFSLIQTSGDIDASNKLLTEHIGHILTPVTSGHSFIDLIVPGINKGYGIELLQKHLNITRDECMAFGDAANDIEMLQSVKYGYAMKNAKDEVKRHVHRRAPANHEDGVLEVIEHFFEHKNEYPIIGK